MVSRMAFVAFVALALSSGSTLLAQGRGGAAAQPAVPGQTNDPFPQPIVSGDGVIVVTLREFASLPDIDSVPARLMTLVEDNLAAKLRAMHCYRSHLHVLWNNEAELDEITRSYMQTIGAPIGEGALAERYWRVVR